MPSLSTLRIMLVTRNVVAGSAIDLGRRRASARCARHPLTIRVTAVSGTCVPRVGEHRERLGDLERRQLEDAERNRRIAAQRRLADAGSPPQRRDGVEAGLLGQLDRGDVARQRQRAAQRDHAVVLVVVVARRPVAFGQRPRRRLVEQQHRRRDVGALIRGRLIEGRQVDERLEHRAGLAPGAGGAVELRLVVGAPADQRQHLAGARVDGDQRRLRSHPAAPLGQRLVDRGQPGAHGVLGRPLQVEVERRVDLERARLRWARPGCSASRRWPTKSTKYGASKSSARAATCTGSCTARSAASAVMKPASAIARSTTSRRSLARPASANGEWLPGDWITPAMSAPSPSVRLLRSLA